MIKLKTPNFEVCNNRKIKYIIIHYTDMKTLCSAIKRLQSKVAKVSCHYVISKKGTIYQLVNEKDIAWHAGISKWGKDTNLNNKSIGIELDNNGFEDYPNKQIKSLIKLIKKIKKKYKIRKNRVLGHSHIAPDRKIDPGPKFPWKVLNRNNLSNLY